MVNLIRVVLMKKNSNQVILSGILVSVGAGLILGWTFLLKYIMYVGIALRENSYLADMWQVNPMPLHLEVYMFNWTNPQDIYNPDIKPKFKQIGPFVFKEIREKGNVTWNNENSTVSFQQYHTYFFVREKSVADLSLPITTLNPVLASAAYQADRRGWGFWMRKGMQISITQFGQKLHTTKPVGAFLFDGYDDIFVSMGQQMPFIEGLPPFDKFGWFYTRNASSFEGTFNMGTRIHNFGLLERWNYSNRTDYYEGECGTFEETSASELYLPHRTKDQISMFSPDMCRRVPLDFDSEMNVNGILGYKYSAGDSFLDNGTMYPENSCFCPGECLPSGAVNISSCKYGAPGFVSLPNFYNADEHYIRSIEGLKPEKDKHEFQITLEPLTGIPLKVSARLQLNLFIKPVKYLTMFDNVPKLLFPVLWFEEVVELPSNLQFLLKVLLALPMVCHIGGLLAMIIGLFLISQLIYTQINQSLQQYATAAGDEPQCKKASSSALVIKELFPLNPKIVHNELVCDEYNT